MIFNDFHSYNHVCIIYAHCYTSYLYTHHPRGLHILMGFLGEVFVPCADCHCLVDVWLCFLRGTSELVGQEISYRALSWLRFWEPKDPRVSQNFLGHKILGVLGWI